MPGLLRARVGLRPRLAEDQGRARTNGGWAVTGQKVWTTFAHEAKWCMLVARTRPGRAQAQGPHLLPDGHGAGRGAGAAAAPDHRRGRVQRALHRGRLRSPTRTSSAASGNGWMVAITTLMNERAGLGASARARRCKIALGELIELAQRARRRRRPGRSASESPSSTSRSRRCGSTRCAALTAIDEDRHPRARRARSPSGSGRDQPGAHRAGDRHPRRRGARSWTTTGPTASCARARTRSRAAPPRSSRTSSPSACSACRSCGSEPRELRLQRRPAARSSRPRTTSSPRASSPRRCASWPRPADVRRRALEARSASSAGPASSSPRSTAARASAWSSW